MLPSWDSPTGMKWLAIANHFFCKKGLTNRITCVTIYLPGGQERKDSIMKKNTRKIKTTAEIVMGMRKDWGAISPVTRVIPDKRRKAPKHKGRQYEG